MPQLDDWLAWAPVLEQIYQEELGRSAFSDQQAFVNWTYHWREGGHSADWVRARIRESEEWRQRHHGNPSEPVPDTPPPPAPTPSDPLPPMTSHPRVFPVTTPDDGVFHQRFYSYWSNAHVTGNMATVFAGHQDGRPRFFRVHLESGHVERQGPVIGYSGTTEGWYWDRQGRIYLHDGPRLRRVDPVRGDDRVIFDNDDFQSGTRLWQPHSSDDGRVHSATVEQIVSNGAYPRIGTVVWRNGERHYFPATAALDESAIDTSGRFLLIKETRQRDKPRLDNRIIDFQTGQDRWLTDEEGAIGHSDMGDGFVVGEDDQIGGCVWMNLRDFADRRTLFSTWNMGHVSVRNGRCLSSDGSRLALVALDGSGTVVPLVNHDSPEPTGANLDHTGRVAAYVVRGRVYLLVI